MIIKGHKAPTSKSIIPSKGGIGPTALPQNQTRSSQGQDRTQRHFNGILDSKTLALTSVGSQQNPKFDGKGQSAIYDQNGNRVTNAQNLATQAITEEATSALENLTHVQTQKIDSHAAINPYTNADGAGSDTPLMRGNSRKAKSNAQGMNLAQSFPGSQGPQEMAQVLGDLSMQHGVTSNHEIGRRGNQVMGIGPGGTDISQMFQLSQKPQTAHHPVNHGGDLGLSFSNNLNETAESGQRMAMSGSEVAGPVVTDGEMGTFNLHTVQRGMTERAGQLALIDFQNNQSSANQNIMQRRMNNQKTNKTGRPSVSQNQNRSHYRRNIGTAHNQKRGGQSAIPKNLEIKYRKDMQQLKFYQTLNNYQNLIKQPQVTNAFSYQQATQFKDPGILANQANQNYMTNFYPNQYQQQHQTAMKTQMRDSKQVVYQTHLGKNGTLSVEAGNRSQLNVREQQKKQIDVGPRIGPSTPPKEPSKIDKFELPNEAYSIEKTSIDKKSISEVTGIERSALVQLPRDTELKQKSQLTEPQGVQDGKSKHQTVSQDSSVPAGTTPLRATEESQKKEYNNDLQKELVVNFDKQIPLQPIEMTSSKVKLAPLDNAQNRTSSKDLKQSDGDGKLSATAARSASQNPIASIKQDLYANNLYTFAFDITIPLLGENPFSCVSLGFRSRTLVSFSGCVQLSLRPEEGWAWFTSWLSREFWNIESMQTYYWPAPQISCSFLVFRPGGCRWPYHMDHVGVGFLKFTPQKLPVPSVFFWFLVWVGCCPPGFRFTYRHSTDLNSNTLPKQKTQKSSEWRDRSYGRRQKLQHPTQTKNQKNQYGTG